MSSRSTDSIYLDKLKFDPNLKNSFMHGLITNVRLIALVLISLLGAGIFSFINLPRELNPEVNIPIVNIVTTLPGASPTDVETLITQEIESEIENLASIDVMTSVSSNSLSVITIQFVSSQNPDDAVDQVQQRVNLVSDLPEDASDPRVTKLDFNEQPVWIVALTGDTNRYSLTTIADQIATDLEAAPGIRRVDVSGDIEEEIVVRIKPETLLQYNLTPDAINGALQANNLTLPAGSLTVGGLEYTLSVNNQFETIDQVRNLQINSGGQPIALGQVADVYYQAKDSNTIVYNRKKGGNRQPATQLSIFKTQSATIIDAVDAARQVLDEQVGQHPTVSYTNVIDLAKEIDDSFAELQSNFASTIALVFAVLFIFLGLRQAAIASISIPLTFLSAFIIMNIAGISLNFLSLFSLLLALGLVVDDAIVIVQAAANYGKKFTPLETGLLIYNDFVVPIWTTTLTTVWAFLPLILASGIIGEFIKSIPIVVSATLLSSTTIAVLINIPLTTIFAEFNPPKRVRFAAKILAFILVFALINIATSGSPLKPLTLLAFIILTILSLISRKSLSNTKPLSALNKFSASVLSKSYPHLTTKLQNLTNPLPLPKNINTQSVIEQGVVNFRRISNRYQNLLTKILRNSRRRYQVYGLTAGFVIVSFAFLATGLLKNEFFPAADGDNLYINLEAPAGTHTEVIDDLLVTLEDQIVDLPELDSITTTTGRAFDPSTGDTSSGSNKGYLSLTLLPAEDRDRTSIELAQNLRDQFESFDQGTVTIAEMSGGPPAGAEFQINIKGDDLTTLETIANDFAAIVESIDGAINVDTSLELTPGEIQVQLIPQELAERNLSAAAVGGWLRTALSGSQTTTLKSGESDTDITVILDKDAQTLDYLQNLSLPSQFGTYTLGQVAEFTLASAPVNIVREDGTRVVRVTAGTEGVSSQQLLQEFTLKVDSYQTPKGYTWDTGGVNEENERSVQSILQAMLLSAVLILVTMVLQLESFRKAFIVMMVIPLAVAGVFFNFTILGIPLSFPALIGVLALFGIVVNNSIMLVEKINQNLKQGFTLTESITDACGNRIEPIFLTSLTTSFGLLPITLSDPLWRGLGGSIIAGLSVSGILILFLLPTIYYEVYKSDTSIRH